MKNLFLILLINCLFLGCTQNQVTEEICKKEGKIYKVNKVLNLRSGNYEDKAQCI
ncbi:MAG: hypothetical protein AB7S49_11090 [Arcobacter sp.]|jgi:hypothetical protein|uniref:Lipoprotein n=1 Tax=Arcobacter defluvii TaxID=873191 RepID=A0AAE7E7S4_9BACT|nr:MULTISPECIES: hypothetical protein [Arcobacter]QKF77723.1 hypothetical protein ADFLV_1703 [Arcobacter defluvii]